MKVSRAEIVVSTMIVAVLGYIAYPFLIPKEQEGHRTFCLSTVRQLGTSTQIYLSDSNDVLPLDPWMDCLSPYAKNEQMYTCVELKSPLKYGYAYHLPLVGQPTSKFPVETTVLFFETDALGRNVVANLAARDLDRHKGGSNVVYLDNHARIVPKGESP